MKKLLAILLSVLLFSFCFLSVQAASLPTDAVIVVSENASDTDNYAAKMLQDYLKQGGLDLPIVTDTTAPAAFELRVGNTARTAPTLTSTTDGAYRIENIEGGVQIVGAGNRGTIYGVYGFLEKVCGFHWYAVDVTVIPDVTKLELPDDILIDYEPAFEYTDTDWLSPRNDQYSLANGLNGGPYRKLTTEQGGTVDYISNFCHTLTTQFCAADTYFAEHPEYFALHNGERVPQQLCLSNEEVVQIVTREVFDILAQKHDPTAAVQIVSLTQHDNQEYCQCDNCKAIDDANGSPSGSMITFVNKVAAAVKEAGFDNIAIDTFAYQYTRKAPTQVVPLDNVIVRLCTIECCFSHPLGDATCEQNAALKADLENWNMICDRIYVWDYATNYAYTLGLFPDFGVLQSNMQFFRDHGVKGVYEEGNYYMAACNTEFGDLRAYQLSKLLQDPACDLAAETAGFLTAYYGEGGEDIGHFLDFVTENSAKNHLTIYISMDKTLSLTEEEVAQCDAWWASAKEKTTDEAAKARIERSELCWRFWKACNKEGEFKGIKAFKNNRQLYLDILALGTTQYREGSQIFAQYPTSSTYLNPHNWNSLTNTPLPGIVAGAFYALAVILALVLFVLAIRTKKYLYLVHLPLLAVFIEIGLWNRRAYLAWVDLGQFALTLILFILAFAFVAVATSLAQDKNKIKAIVSGIVGGLSFLALFFVPSYIINIILDKGNQLAISASIIAYSTVLIVMLAVTTHRLKKIKS